MYEHRNPTIGRDKTIPGMKKPVVKKPVLDPIEDKKPIDCKPVKDKKPTDCKPVKDKKPVDCKPVDKKPIEDKKPPVKDDKKPKVDPWSLLLFGPPRQQAPTDKAERPRGFWW